MVEFLALIDICTDIYVMLSSDLHGMYSHCIYGTSSSYWPTGSGVSEYTGLPLLEVQVEGNTHQVQERQKDTLDHDGHTHQVSCHIWGNECC